MNIHPGCKCAVQQPAPAPAPAAVAQSRPAAESSTAAAAPGKAAVSVVSQSYFVGYFSHAYVSAAAQTAAQAGVPAAPAAAATQVESPTAAQPMEFEASVLRFGMAVMAAYSMLRADQGSAAGPAATVLAADGKPAKPVPAETAVPAEKAGPAAVTAEAPVVRFLTPPSRQVAVPQGDVLASAPAVSPAPSATASTASGAGTDQPAAVERFQAEDFQKFRMRQLSVATESSFSLDLRTREGDRISLDFSQIDAMVKTRFRGVDADGGRLRVLQTGESMQRLVNMEIVGDISEQERDAIEALLDKVVELANAFFGGSMQAALEKVRDLDFDTSTLLDVSLQMSLSRSMEMTRGYRNEEAGLERLSQQDGNVTRTLEFLGQAQRELVAEAKDVLEDRSAATMIRSLLPVLLEPRPDVEATQPGSASEGTDRDA